MPKYNTLNSINFDFQIEKIKEVSFSCQTANIPGMSLGQSVQPTPLRPLPIPGDSLQYDSLDISFLVDENMSNYLEIYKWLKGLGFPSDQQQYADLLVDTNRINQYDGDKFSEATLFVLSNNSNVAFEVNFTSCFPTNLSGLNFVSTDADTSPFIASTSFMFADFNIVTST